MKKGIIISLLTWITANGLLYGQSRESYVDSMRQYIVKGIPDKAFTNYQKAKHAGSMDLAFADTITPALKKLAELNFNKGERNLAIAVSNEILKIVSANHGEMNSDYAWTCNMLGAVYNLMGKLDTARTFHIKAMEIREKVLGNSDPFYAQSCNNLGFLYRDCGQFDEAEILLLKAKEIRQRNREKSPRVYAITCTGLADLYRDIGQYEKAEQLYQEARDTRALQGKEDNADYANSCLILADLYSYTYMAKPEKAEPLYFEAKDIIAKIDSESIDFGHICNNLASLYRDMGRYPGAEALALQAKKIFEDNEDEVDLTINLNGLGELYYAMGDYQKAGTYFLMARKKWKKSLDEDHPYIIANSDELARLYWKTNEIGKAGGLFEEMMQSKYKQLNKVFRFTTENEKQLYLKNITGTSDLYQSFCYKKKPHNLGGQSYAMSLQYRNLILASTQELRRIIYSKQDTSLTKLYTGWVTVKKQLANLYLQGAGASPRLTRELEDTAANLEKSLTRLSSGFEKMQTKLSWQDIKRTLTNEQAAIEFISFRLSEPDHAGDSILYAALLLRKNIAEPVLVPLFEEKELNDLTAQRGGDEATTINQLYSSPKLFDLAWKPLEKHLAGITTIYYSLSGNLFRVAFGAIPLNDKQRLSDKYRLIQLNTTATLAQAGPGMIKSSDNIRLYGGIDYDADTITLKKVMEQSGYNVTATRSLPDDLTRGSSFGYLPGTKQETDEIKKWAAQAGLKVSLLSGVDATKESLLALNEASSPVILHIATHGFFFDDPSKDSLAAERRQFETSGKIFRESQNPLFRTGLLFAGGNNAWRGRASQNVGNGIVTGYEISNSLYLPNTKLVVLSACETARGQVEGSEGVYGLQRAFKIAGVQNLVMSLWKVPDAETSEFMQSFYRNMFAHQSINDAFYHAQGLIRAKYRNEPYKWAAWILVK